MKSYGISKCSFLQHKDEYVEFNKFRDLLKKPDNYYSLYFIGSGREKPKNDKKNLDSDGFYSKYEKLSFNVFELIAKSFELSLFLFWGFLAIDSIFDFTKLELNFDI